MTAKRSTVSPSTIRARHIMIVVTNLPRSVQFYRDVIGLELVTGSDYRLKLGDGFEIHLCDVDPADPKTYMEAFTQSGPAVPVFAKSFAQAATHLAIEVHDAQPILERLLDGDYEPFQIDTGAQTDEGGSQADPCRSVRIQSAHDKLLLGARSIYVYDPDGNLIEVGQWGLSSFV